MSGVSAFQVGDASYQAAGGYEGIFALVTDFYGYMNTLPEARIIRAMHADDLHESIDKLTCFLSGWLGGPKLYREKYGTIIIPLAHKDIPIGVAERDAWLLCMDRALEDQSYEQDFKEYLLTQLKVPAEFCRNQD